MRSAHIVAASFLHISASAAVLAARAKVKAERLAARKLLSASPPPRLMSDEAPPTTERSALPAVCENCAAPPDCPTESKGFNNCPRANPLSRAALFPLPRRINLSWRRRLHSCRSSSEQ
jgi:hypothetical protein